MRWISAAPVSAALLFVPVRRLCARSRSWQARGSRADGALLAVTAWTRDGRQSRIATTASRVWRVPRAPDLPGRRKASTANRLLNPIQSRRAAGRARRPLTA